jgi:hypothetical protein
MARPSICALVLVAGSALAQVNPSEQASALQAIREYALNYIQRLPDYTCTQVTRRSSFALQPRRGASVARPDVIEEQVNLVNHAEIHKVTKINGSEVSNIEHDQLPGGMSRGEFGSLLGIIFDPETQADFHFDRIATLDGRKMYVFDFRVPQSMGYNLAEPKRTIRVPYTGSAYADVETKAVMRLDIKCVDIPAASQFKALELRLDFKPARVAGREFILPSHYLLQFRNGDVTSTNEAEYKGYRRFSAEATLKFDDDPQ